MAVDLDYLKEIIAVAKESGLSEIEVTEGERTYRCVIQAPSQKVQTQICQSVEVPEEPAIEAPKVNYHQIKSPMVGSVYLAPSPGEQPFVMEGQTVKKGDVLCLIEAMKMFNKVKADRAGIIKTCLVQDGSCAEFDQVLFEIE